MTKSSINYALAALLSASLIAGCGNNDPQALLKKGQKYAAEGKTQAAIIEYKNALQINPSLRDARYALGMVYLETGDAKSAEKELRKAKALGIQNPELDLAIARTLVDQGMWKELLAEFKIAPNTPPKFAADLHALRGHAHFSLDAVPQARDEYNKALALVPHHATALAGLARADLRENKLAEAEARVADAVQSAPKDAEAWIVKGDIARSKKDLPAAAAAYKKALEFEPKSTLAKLNLISVEIQQGQFELAQTHLNELREIAPNNAMLYYQQGLIDFQNKRYAEASAAARKVLQGAPNHTPSLLLEGAAQFLLGANEQAEQALRRVVSNAPANVYARKLLAATLLKLKDPQRALEYLLPAVEALPNDAQLQALAANAYMQLGQSGKAAEMMKAAVEHDPKSAALRTDLGMLQLAAGDSAAAAATLQQASELDPSRTQADMILVVSHLRDKKYDAALAILQRLEQRAPNDPSMHNMRGAAYLGLNDLNRARASFERAVALNPTFMPAVANLAQLDLRAKNVAAARGRFESVLAKDKNNILAMTALAQFEASQGGLAKSIQWLERARAVQPPALEPRLILARLYLETRQPQKALAVAAEAQKINPQHPDSLDVLGSAQLGVGESDNAFATFSQLVKAYPNSALAHYRLALAHMAKREWNLGINELNRSVELDPRMLDAHAALVAAYLQTGDSAKALAQARTVKEKNPKLAIGYILEGNALLAQNKPGDALVSYQQAYKITPNAATINKVFQARQASGDRAGAVAELQEWLKAHPDDMLNRLVLADGFVTERRFDLAAREYQTVLKAQPNHPVALNNLAWSLHELKDPRALEVAEKALSLQPNNPAIMDTVAWLLIKEKRTGRAISLLEKAAERSDAPEIRYHLAVALAQSGDKLRAKRELEKALSSKQPFAQVAEARILLRDL